MLEESVGKRSNKVKNTIERGAVRKFVQAIGDPAPIFIDEQAGIASRYGQNIAPPTFPVTFDAGKIDGLDLPSKGLIHGEQLYQYVRPLLIGEDVYCWMEVKDYYEKSGSLGDMGFLVIIKKGENANGELLFTEERIVIINKAARKGRTA